ncbi:MAG TPA: leucyl aminopeptidase [Thermoleophilaceae bacterium]|nr:leucyl aminopeptidase [Thermoleophilaceae bacterium]
MREIAVTARPGAPEETAADTRVLGLFDGEHLPEPELQQLVQLGEAKSGLGKVAVTHEQAPGGGSRRVLIAGLGKREEFDGEAARTAAAAAAGRARELGAVSLSWALPDDGAEVGLVEGTLLKLYSFDRFKSKSDGDPNGLETLEIAGSGASEKAARDGRIAAEAVNRARELQNLPSNVADPIFLAGRAQEIADAHESVELELLGRDEIVQRGMGAFAAVAQGTPTEPRLIVLRYRGGDQGPHLGFVGKAVTFDTGGISLKPGAKMAEMKFDMSGGAAVLESIDAVAKLEVPVTITAVVPATENMPSGHAIKPGDIVTALNGKTIEINNTDAEGRLILADALSYAVEQGAERIVDLATLTGAIIVALGSTHAGLFSNDDDWFQEVDAACTATGELGWRLPLHRETAKLVEGTFADLDNAPAGRKASSITAAHFLGNFVGDVPWVHMDIAGTAWELGRPYVGKGASGFGVRALIELARRSADA